MSLGVSWWVQWVALMGAEAGLVILAGAVMVRFLGNPSSARVVWQAVLIGIVMAWTSEVIGLRSWVPTSGSLVLSDRTLKVRVEDGAGLSRDGGADAMTGMARGSVSAEEEGSVRALALPSRWPVFLWLAGTVLVLARISVGRVLLWIRSRDAIEETTIPEVVERLRVRMGLGRVRVIRWRSFRGPVTFDVVRPTVALPMDFETRFEPGQAAAILAHELAHLAGRDPFWMLMSDGVCALGWWHPGVWWVRRQLHAACESVADSASGLVPDGRLALAESLVAFGRELTATGGMGVGGCGRPTELARRVRALLAEDIDGGWCTPGGVGTWILRTSAGVLALGFAVFPVAMPMGIAPLRVLAGRPGGDTAPRVLEKGLDRALQTGGIAAPAAAEGSTNHPADGASKGSWHPVVEGVAVTVQPVTELWMRLTLAPPRGETTAYVPLPQPGENAARPTGGRTSTSASGVGPVVVAQKPIPADPASGTVQAKAESATDQIQVQVRLIEMGWGSWESIDWIFGGDGGGEERQATPATTPLSPDLAAVVGAGARLERIVAGSRWVTLSPAQMAAFLKKIQPGQGIDVLATPKVTTLSGRSAQITIGETLTVATGPTTGTNLSYAALPLSVGVTVDLTPTVVSGGFMETGGFRVPVHVRTTEFRGYNAPPKGSEVKVRDAQGKPVKGVVALPRIRLREVVAEPFCRPGEVIVLRGPNNTNVVQTVDRVVGLGSVPLLGRLFTTRSIHTNVTRLYVVLEPVWIDPAGQPGKP